MNERDSWLIKIQDAGNDEIFGLGEAAPLPGLSLELDEEFEQNLKRLVEQFNALKWGLAGDGNLTLISKTVIERIPELPQFPSILFAFEMALLDLSNGGQRLIFKNSFIEGQPIPINGLIWMSGMDMMLQQIEIKIQEGFDCLKLKVGGLDFEKECDILQYIRRKYFKMDITLRLDANGAFKEDEVMYKLHELAKFDIHSIEQPIKPGNDLMVELCKSAPIPIALDEELIGVAGEEAKETLLGRIKPQYIILKPSLHGGLSGCQQWIEIAEKMKVGWWMTSALESNIGLNAIAQFTAEYTNALPQGLGTGKIYDDNIESPLLVKTGKLSYTGPDEWGVIDFS
ncbi:MAG: o-succinylbenzoate synthase [Cyclobacteriaceae bacterium]